MWALVLVLAGGRSGGQHDGRHGARLCRTGRQPVLDIPFAAPPVGALRWSAPEAFSWSGVLRATSFGPACIQPGSDWSELSEDCLTINVVAPPNASAALVLFWIYGGSLVTGASSLPVYSGALAMQGVVVVTFDYRLGLLGFAALPGLHAHAMGAFGFLDQQLALRWTHDNAAAFGGDPNKITIMGESAGAPASCIISCRAPRDPAMRVPSCRAALQSARACRWPKVLPPLLPLRRLWDAATARRCSSACAHCLPRLSSPAPSLPRLWPSTPTGRSPSAPCAP
jgi:carboxylesterase type B